MRLGVLDIGSNTGHLLVVDAHDGAAPLPAYSYKEPLRLAEHLDDDGAVAPAGVEALSAFTAQALVVAEDKGCEEMLAFATSAVRDATNSEAVLDEVGSRSGVRIQVLSGEDEARLTFLAVRRWFGWSSGRLAVFDIGGGSLEIAAGKDEAPDVAWSLPLGAARLAAEWFGGGAPDDDTVRKLRKQIRAEIARDAGNLLRSGRPDHAVATSKTFRSLARICGAAPSGDGPLVSRVLPADELRGWIPRLVAMDDAALAELPGVSPNRTHQIVSGRARRRGRARHLRPRGARDLSVGAARGRDPRAHRPVRARGGPAGDHSREHLAMTRIGLSTASVYPESSAHAFGYAASLGYDAVEVMVGIDALSQQTSAVKQLAEHHDIAISAIHAPCLLFTQRVWGTEPWGKLERSAEMAEAVGAETVVVHPPFRWQKEYAAGFVEGIAALEASTGIAFAVENMYPWRASSRRGMEMYLPGWDPSDEPYANTTIDLSHASIARSDPVAMAERLGDRLRHIHLTDGSGLGQGRAPRARARHHRRRGVPRAPRADRLRGRHRARDQHPQVHRPRRAHPRPARVAGVRPHALRGRHAVSR